MKLYYMCVCCLLIILNNLTGFTKFRKNFMPLEAFKPSVIPRWRLHTFEKYAIIDKAIV